MNVPNGVKYTDTHEWLRREEDGSVTIGITDHAQKALGDLVYVELPAVGRQVTAGEACAVVESVKAASEVYAPITGEVIEVNQALVDEPATINSDPMGKGWFMKLRLANASELDGLMDEAGYKKFVEGLH